MSGPKPTSSDGSKPTVDDAKTAVGQLRPAPTREASPGEKIHEPDTFLGNLIQLIRYAFGRT